MRLVTYPPSSPWGRGSLRRRSAAFLLALAVHLLLLLLLFRLAPPQSRPPAAEAEPNSFSLLPVAAPQAAPKPAAHAARKPAGGARRVPTPRAAPTPPPPTPPHATGPLNMMVVSKDVFQAADIAGLPSHHAAAQSADSGSGSGAGQDSGAGDGSEAGPNGERLYNADWYRKPTHAEMAPYLPAGIAQPGSWGLIACRTVANYRVEDCRELADSPAGSGLARAVRQAAWQFRVLPPRIGGKPLVGAWVRIRFDFTTDPAK